jgi:hypothetical protein
MPQSRVEKAERKERKGRMKMAERDGEWVR